MNSPAHFSPDKPMHIAFAISNFSRGGAGRVIFSVARGLIARGHRVDLVSFDMHVDYPDEVPDGARLFVLGDAPHRATDRPGYERLCERIVPVNARDNQWSDGIRLANALKWHPLILPSSVWLQRARQIAGYIQQEKPDIILPSLPKAKVSTMLARRLVDNPPPVVPTIHGIIRSDRKCRRLRYKTLFPNAAQIVTVSKGVADSVSAQLGISKAKVTTIYNPVVSPEIDKLKTQNPEHPWFVDDGPPVILGIGRLLSQKDFPTLIRAFARVLEQRPCRLIILGEGELRRQLEALVAELSLQNKVALPGWSDNPYSAMARAALFVLSSNYEGLGNVLIEALACGCPCVSTDCPSGPAEILQDGEIGPLVPVGDHVALANAMLNTLDNPPDKRTLLNRCAFFSVENSVNEYEKLIMEIVQQDIIGKPAELQSASADGKQT